MLEELKNKLARAVEVFKEQLAKVRTGRAHPEMVEGLMVESYGQMMPLKQMAGITAPDASTLAIQPWDKANLSPIEKALTASDLGLTPMNDGQTIRLTLPPLSQERRQELAKLAGGMAEDAKVVVRNLRRETMEVIDKQAKNKEIGEDEKTRLEKQVQDVVDSTSEMIDSVATVKQKEITTI